MAVAFLVGESDLRDRVLLDRSWMSNHNRVREWRTFPRRPLGAALIISSLGP
jgi:hypothetical protein